MVFSGDISALQLPVAAFTLNCWCTLRTLQHHIPQPQILCSCLSIQMWCHLEGTTSHTLCGQCMLLDTTSSETSNLAPVPAKQHCLLRGHYTRLSAQHAWVVPLHLETPWWVWNGPWLQNTCLNSQGSPARSISWPIEDRLHIFPWEMVGCKKLSQV